MMEFAEMIKEARRKKEMTVYDLARELGLKSPGYISRIEGKGEIPAPEIVIKLAEVLGLNVEAMVKLAASEKASVSSRQVHEKFVDAFVLYRKIKQEKEKTPNDCMARTPAGFPPRYRKRGPSNFS